MVPLQKRLLLLVSPYDGFPKMMSLSSGWMLDLMKINMYDLVVPPMTSETSLKTRQITKPPKPRLTVHGPGLQRPSATAALRQGLRRL